MLKISALAVLLACLLPQIGRAGLIGEPAPAFSVQEWVKNGPVQIKTGSNLVVVVIWQTALPSSRLDTTNFNALQEHYRAKGVQVAAICDEPSGDLKEFFQSGASNVEFAVAADANHQTAFAYMNPIGYHGVPYFFIVGTNGTVLWHSWTVSGLSEALDEILGGRFDLELQKKNETARVQMQQYLSMVRRHDTRAPAAGRTLLANRTNDVQLLCSMAMEIISTPGLSRREVALANEALKQAEHLQTTNNNEVKFARAVFVFETGHPEQGLMQATQALALATNPLDKAVIESGIRTMQNRWKVYQATERAKTNQANRAQSPVPAGSPGAKPQPTTPAAASANP